jgi:hypothetical protein
MKLADYIFFTCRKCKSEVGATRPECPICGANQAPVLADTLILTPDVRCRRCGRESQTPTIEDTGICARCQVVTAQELHAVERRDMRKAPHERQLA